MKKLHSRILVNTIILGLLTACGVSKSSMKSSGKEGVGDTRTEEPEYYSANTYLLKTYASDTTYGYSKENPVCVGGIHDDRALDPTKAYLSALLGPNGEHIKSFRYGSCCGFKTPNGMIENMGLLDHYAIFWEGSDTLSLFINIYDKGNLYIPLGLKSKQ